MLGAGVYCGPSVVGTRVGPGVVGTGAMDGSDEGSLVGGPEHPHSTSATGKISAQTSSAIWPFLPTVSRTEQGVDESDTVSTRPPEFVATDSSRPQMKHGR